MASNFNKPILTDLYADVLQYVRDNFAALAQGLDPAVVAVTNRPTNTVRWNSANKRWEKYNGSAWAALESSYAIDISGSAAKWSTGRTITFTGAATGVSGPIDGSANISIELTQTVVPINKGGTGATTAAGLLNVVKTVDGSGSGLDADLLDGLDSTAFATAAQGTKADNAMQFTDARTTLTTEDLDTLVTNGRYRWFDKNLPNNPYGASCFAIMLVENDAAQPTQFVYLSHPVQRTYFRRRTGGTWNAWTEFRGKAEYDALYASAAHLHAGTYEPVLTAASRAEMEAGVETALRSMSPLRVAQAIAALSPPVAFFESAPLIITNNSGQSVAHGLGAIPKNFQAVLRCVTAQLGYAVGDEVIVPSSDGHSGVGDFGCTVSASATSLYVSTFANGIRIANKSSWAKATITNANWRFVLRAWSK